jgi:single-strand DNA-binding protein
MFNSATLVGNAGKGKAELRYTTQGKAVVTFSLATNESYRDKEGNFKTRTTWFKCTAWDKLAESVAKNVTEGRKLMVVGPVGAEAWNDGEGKARAQATITVREIRYLDSNAKDDGETAEEEFSGEAPVEE